MPSGLLGSSRKHRASHFLNADPGLKDWMKEQLEAWRQKVLSAEEEQEELRRRIEALAPAMRPEGVGAYSTAVLEYEMKGWQRFHNRGQVSSYTGLCPGIHQSDGRGKEGSINRCGNRVVRWNLVEMVWRLMVWQPHYGPVRQLAGGLGRRKRAKRRLVGKAARQVRFMAFSHRPNHGRKTRLNHAL